MIDAISYREPNKLAMLHISQDKTERRFTFTDIRHKSSQCANYFKSLGIKKGDRVILVLKRHYQFWFAMLGLHKLGAIAIPATNQLQSHDFEYRFKSAGVCAILCTADGDTAAEVDIACEKFPQIQKLIVNGTRDGWRTFDEEYTLFSSHFERTPESPCGDDLMLMYFTSGTSGYPKIAAHSYKYRAGPFPDREILAQRRSRRPALHDLRYRLGKGGLGQDLRPVAVRSRDLRLRLRPLPRRGHPADVREIQDHDLLRAADDAAHDDQAGYLQIRPQLRQAYDDRRRSAEPRGLPPV